MKFHRAILGLGFLFAACAPATPPPVSLPLPTATNGIVVSTATSTPTTLPTATSTPVPPTATAEPTFTPTATATATSTATPRPSATPTLPAFLLTQDTPMLPTGKGGLIIINHYPQELDYDIDGKLYKIPAQGRMVIFLSPGRYNFSATIPGYSGKSGNTEVLDGYYRSQEWGS